jgi:hypothetical protein
MSRKPRPAVILAVLTVLVLLLSTPSSLRYMRDNHTLYLFSEAFFEDIPKRLFGPGRFRFFVQPLVAIALGIRDGIADARAGRPAYFYGVLFDPKVRGALLKSSFTTLLNMILFGVLLDSICQWLILGNSYLGAALVVGPVLIVAPYTMSRSVTRLATPSAPGRGSV